MSASGSQTPGSRCFVAVLPPEVLVGRLRSMQRPERDGLRWTRESQWHVTVAFFASVAPAELASCLDRLSSALPGPPSLRAASGPHPLALGGRVWVLPVEGLGDLADAVSAGTSDLGETGDRRSARPFRGHLTLARARYPGALRGLPQPDLEVSWEPAEVVAFLSHLDRSGARHEVIGRWDLPRG